MRKNANTCNINIATKRCIPVYSCGSSQKCCFHSSQLMELACCLVLPCWGWVRLQHNQHLSVVILSHLKLLLSYTLSVVPATATSDMLFVFRSWPNGRGGQDGQIIHDWCMFVGMLSVVSRLGQWGVVDAARSWRWHCQRCLWACAWNLSVLCRAGPEAVGHWIKNN